MGRQGVWMTGAAWAAAATLTACALQVRMGEAVVYEPKPSTLSLEQAVAGDWRSERFVARDVYRHPVQVLRFFRVKPEHAVVEVWPGGGYWTEILAPYLRGRGQYTAAHFVVSDPNAPDWRRAMVQRFVDKLRADPRRYGEVKVTEVGLPDRWQMTEPESADRVLTFRNVHNWIKGGYAERMFEAFYAALKPGGELGVVEHRAAPGTSLQRMIDSGYVTERYVIELAHAAGFRLLERSEINANPRDSRDHPAGVWTLPPTLRLGEVDREKYLAIGESDRMSLRFVKPVQLAPKAD